MPRNERWRRFRKSSRTWSSPVLPLLGGALAGGTLALGASALSPGDDGASATWLFIFGFLVLSLPILLVQHVADRVVREVRALVNIRPLTGARLLATDPWAMDAVFAEQLLSLVDEGPGEIVELGSGHSTVLIAERLAARGNGAGRVTAVDHLEAFADRTRGWLAERGLEERARVIHAPIEERVVEDRRMPWYAPEPLKEGLPERIDLLVVDGPPDVLGRDARWPAVPLLRDHLAPGAVILMDDGDRPDERAAARDWHALLGGRMRYVPGGKGAWILRLPR